MENRKEVFNEASSFNTGNSEDLLVPTKEQYFVCDICDFTSKQMNSLLVHIAQHTAQKPLITCQLCHLKFTQRASFNFHMKKKHLEVDEVQEKLFRCSSCNFSSDEKANFEKHVCKYGISTKEETFKCDIRDQEFKQQGDLQAHTKIRDSKKQFVCKFCQAHFTRKATLNIHIKKSHIKKDLYDLQDNVFKCSLCEFENDKKGNLVTHMRIHSGEKPFKCQVCPRKFTQLCHLQVHNRRHTGEKPFACTFCSCKFTQKSNLIVHNMKSHKISI